MAGETLERVPVRKLFYPFANTPEGQVPALTFLLDTQDPRIVPFITTTTLRPDQGWTLLIDARPADLFKVGLSVRVAGTDFYKLQPPASVVLGKLRTEVGLPKEVAIYHQGTRCSYNQFRGLPNREFFEKGGLRFDPFSPVTEGRSAIQMPIPFSALDPEILSQVGIRFSLVNR